MVVKYLQCDICGDKWDITGTRLNDSICPSMSYVTELVKNGKRKYIIKKGTATDDGRLELDCVDICDECYNKLNTLFMRIAREGADNEEHEIERQ